MPEQALGWFSVDLGLVLEDEPSTLSCTDHLDFPNTFPLCMQLFVWMVLYTSTPSLRKGTLSENRLMYFLTLAMVRCNIHKIVTQFSSFYTSLWCSMSMSVSPFL